MTDEEFKKMNLKRTIKNANGIDSTEELVALTNHALSFFEELDAKGVFDDIRKEHQAIFEDYLQLHEIVLWQEPSMQIRQLSKLLLEDLKKEDFSTQALLCIICVFEVYLKTLITYCGDEDEEEVEKYIGYNRNDMYYALNEQNYTELLKVAYQDAYEMITDILNYLSKADKKHILCIQSYLTAPSFYIHEIYNDLKYGFDDN